MKYKVGDKVKVREWSDMESDLSCTMKLSDRMIDIIKPYCGKIVKIKEILGGFYKTDIDSYIFWNEDIFEDIEGKEYIIKMKSKTKEVAKLLGLEWDDEKNESEPFTIDQFDDGYEYLINKYGMDRIDGNDCSLYYECFAALITGEVTLSKLPWKPEDGDRCFAVHRSEYIEEQQFSVHNVYLLAMKKTVGYLKQKKKLNQIKNGF